MGNRCAAISEDRELLKGKEVETVFVASRTGAQQRDEAKVLNPTEETGALDEKMVVDLQALGVVLVTRAIVIAPNRFCRSKLVALAWLSHGA
jgi:hypothetical protein